MQGASTCHVLLFSSEALSHRGSSSSLICRNLVAGLLRLDLAAQAQQQARAPAASSHSLLGDVRLDLFAYQLLPLTPRTQPAAPADAPSSRVPPASAASSPPQTLHLTEAEDTQYARLKVQSNSHKTRACSLTHARRLLLVLGSAQTLRRACVLRQKL